MSLVYLFLASAFLLFGCGNSKGGTVTQSTTVANVSIPTIDNNSPLTEEPTLPSNILDGEQLPNGATVLPDGTIILPEIEFDDDFHQQAVIAPATKPSEPEPTEAEVESEPQPTEAEETVKYWQVKCRAIKGYEAQYFAMSEADERELMMVSTKLAKMIKDLSEGEYSGVPLLVFGPFEAPVYKVDGKYRMRVIIKCRLNKETRRLFSELLFRFSQGGGRKITLSIDLNPSNL